MKRLVQMTYLLMLLSMVSNNAIKWMSHSKLKAIMISYGHSDGSKLAYKLDDRLSKLGFEVWYDKKKMRSDTYQAMGVAIEKCDVFLMLESPGYFNSSNCKREAEYAAGLNKKIVPIRVTSGFTPKGWLAVVDAGLTYYNFSDSKNFNKQFEKLLVELM